MARRTDGGAGDPQASRRLPNAQYGENRDYQAAEAAGPMAGAQVLPLTAPTTRPDEPVTAGAASGPGIGPAAAGIQTSDSAADYDHLRYLIAGLEIVANLPGSNPSTRTLLRKLRSSV